MSPTVFRSGPYRFHVETADGEAKFWISPKIELAKNYRLSPKDLRRIEEHEDEIHRAWNHHFYQ